MYRTLNDLRVVKLALAIEDAYEDYEQSLRAAIDDPEIRALLAPLFEDGPAHRELRAVDERLRAAASADEENVDAEDVLQVMLECERSARDLYLRYLDRVSDGALVEILRGLAREEEEHAAIVSRAIRLLRERRAGRSPV